MVEADRNDRDESRKADPDAVGRLADVSASLLAEQAAAMTMMTAIGLSFTGRMASLFLGSLEKPDETSDSEPAEAAPDTEAKVENRTVETAEPVPAQKTKKAAARSGGRSKARADDLKKISGIGPRLEKALQDLGISRFSDMAGWDEATIERIDRELGLDGRIVRDDWVGQARVLAGK